MTSFDQTDDLIDDMATVGHPMIEANRSEPAPLPVAAIVTRKLAEAGVGFGIYKNVASVPRGLAGLADLDVLVAARDFQQICLILTSLKGIRGVPSRFHDNNNSGRADWFIPDDSGGILHLDLAIDLRVGPKFRKRYPALEFDDLSDWRTFSWPGGSLRVVSPEEEARIAILRSVFRLRSRPGQQWVATDPGLASVLRAAFLPDVTECQLRFHIGADEIVCRVRQSGDTVELESAALQRLRRAVRSNGDFGQHSGLSDWFVHRFRQTMYFVARWLTRSDPARTATRRSLQPSGMVVAVVGPDGAGKSTQTKRLSQIFQRKFRCRTLYLGSNEGGFVRRRFVGRHRDARTLSPEQPDADVAKASAGRGSARGAASAAWRLMIALQRYFRVKKAMRLAASGAIVITDRWPQNLKPGILDGPSVLAPGATRPRVLLSRMERYIYRRMERFKPSLTIHLVSDFETSDSRKPGEIGRAAIERRLSLMQEMRNRDPAIVVVDSRQSMDEVSNSLLQNVWFALWVQSAAAERRAISQRDPMRRARPSVGQT